MEIVEIIDHRFSHYSYHHLIGCKNYFYIIASIGEKSRGFLVWPGGEITVRHVISNKRLGRLKAKEVVLEKDKCRCIVGSSFRCSKENWMFLKEEVDDYWTLNYDPATNVKIMDEIMWLLHRLKL